MSDDQGNPGRVYNSTGPGATVTAGAGDDTLNASQGPDVLTGGPGADTFSWGKAPWSPATVTDFVVGQDRLDLAALFQQAGYTGSDPVADKVIILADDGAGGTKVLFDRDGAGDAQPWPDYIIKLDGVAAAGLTWAKLAGSPPAPPPTPSAPGTMVVFAGQSNIGGYGTDASNAPVAWRPDPLTLIWNANSHAWEPLDPGVNTGYAGNPAGWGPEVAFAMDFRGQHPDEVLRIVKYAQGGTSLAPDTGPWKYDWSPDSPGEYFDYVTRMVADASASVGGLKPAMVFWGQGEEDANTAASAQAYGANLAKLFAAIRDQWMHDPKGEIGYFLIGTSPTYAADVRAAQAGVDQADPDAASFDTAGFAMQGDSVHYTPASYGVVGDGFFRLYEASRGAEIQGTAGPDTLTGQGGPDRIQGDAGDDVIAGGDGANWLRGGEGDDQITGGIGFDDIQGNQGSDTEHGGGGADWVVGGRDNDRLYGDDQADILNGNLGDDTCDGGSDSDVVRGGQGNDLVAGGDGNDWLSGDLGDDTLTGGTGADTFHLSPGAGSDRITDFDRAGGDRILLDPGMTWTAHQQGGEVVVDLSGGGQVVFTGTLASLDPGWIVAG